MGLKFGVYQIKHRKTIQPIHVLERENQRPNNMCTIYNYLFTSYSNFHQSGNLILVKKNQI